MIISIVPEVYVRRSMKRMSLIKKYIKTMLFSINKIIDFSLHFVYNKHKLTISREEDKHFNNKKSFRNIEIGR